MLIITGEVIIKQGQMPSALDLALQHVASSRKEPGCISLAVYQDPENALRLFFFEQWASQAAIDAHFAKPSSKAFVQKIQRLVSAPPRLDIFKSEKIN